MGIIEKAKTEGLIFDGAMGTMLIFEGLKGGKASEFWNLEKPDVIRNIHKKYFDAGADVVTTNTFGASWIKLAKAGLEEKFAEINETAVKLAKAAAGKGKYVAGDIGPTGEMLQPYGTLSIAQAVDCFAQQADCLSRAGADLLIIETMFDLNESMLAIQGARSVSSLPVFVTLTFKETKTGFATVMGNRVEESMAALVEAGASAVGANCTIGSDAMIQLAERIRKSVEVPVITQPNAGKPEAKEADVIYPEDMEYFSDNIKKIKALGIEIVGGCCGTTPDYIRRIAEKIR